MKQGHDSNNKSEQPEDKGPSSDERIEKLLSQAENQILAIETDEIIKGYSAEELEEKGMIGNKKIFIPRSAFAEEARKCGFEFASNVEWLVKEGYKDISEVSLSEVEQISDVMPGQLIAVQKAPKPCAGSQASSPGHTDFKEDYLSVANVYVKPEPESLHFISHVQGKVVLFNQRIYVIKSVQDGTFALRIAADKMSAALDLYPAQGQGKQVDLEKIKGAMKAKEVTAGLIPDVLEKSLEKVQKTGSPVLDVIIAEGKKPKNGMDAKPEFFFSTEQTFEEFTVLPDGRVDYRKKAVIQIIHKGDILARIGEPQKGEDGFDISGKAIPHKEGAIEVLCPGENVSVSKDLKEFTADLDGMLSLNGTVLSVFPNYVVERDVDYSSGNIEFGGNILVKGSVLPGFGVKATGDITVMGTVDGAIVIAGRDVRVYGGIIGGPNSIVNCGWNLYAHHLQNATVEVQGDVHISNSSIQSSILCNGKVLAREAEGVLVGGQINALRGVEAKAIGSLSGTKTAIIVGNDFLVQKTIAEIDKVISLYKGNLSKLENVIRPLLVMIHNGVQLSKERKARTYPRCTKKNQKAVISYAAKTRCP